MTLRINEGFEGTNGATLTTGNTVADSFSGAGTSVFDTSTALTGSSSAKFTTSAAVRQYEKNLTSTGTGYFSFYVKPTSAPAGNTCILLLGTASGTSNASLFVTYNSNGTMKLQNSAGVIISSATTDTLPAGEWSRLDISFASGTVSMALFPGNATCNNAVGTALAQNTKSGTTAVTTYAYRALGIGTATTATLNFDSFREDDTALPGPAVAALGVSVSADSSAVGVNTAATLTAVGSGGAGGTKTYAWTKVTGPTGSFGSASAAVTTYTPTVAGSHVLRCTVTDTGTTSTADITITAVDALAFTAASTSGWTATGGTALTILSDTDDATFIESSDNPTALTFDMTLPALVQPTGDLLVPGRFQRVSGSSGSLVATLRDGTTTVATSNTVTPGTSVAAGTFTFLAANISSVSAAKWQAGTLVVRVSATAAP